MNLIQSCWWESLRTVYKAWRVLFSCSWQTRELPPSHPDRQWKIKNKELTSDWIPAKLVLYNLINSDWISSPRNIVVSFLFIDKSAETFHHRFCAFGVCLFVCLFVQKKRKWSVNKWTLWRDVGGVSDDRSACVQQPLRKASGCDVWLCPSYFSWLLRRLLSPWPTITLS